MVIHRSFLENAVPIEQFTFSDNTLVSEASDLRNKDLQQRIYDDAVDVGFSIHSKRTGITVGFYLSHTEIQDGELKWWDYLPIDMFKHKYPRLEDLKVRIFND